MCLIKIGEVIYAVVETITKNAVLHFGAYHVIYVNYLTEQMNLCVRRVWLLWL